MTTARRDRQESPFATWLRDHPSIDSRVERISVTDNDRWIHKYRPHSDNVGIRELDLLMLVEVKTFMAKVPESQWDTLSIVNALLYKATKTENGINRAAKVYIKNAFKRTHPRETREVKWLGVHILQISDDRPDRSEIILWDKKKIDEKILVNLFNLTNDPRMPIRKLDLRRHHTRLEDLNLNLFDA